MIKKRNKIKILFASFIIILLLTVPFTTLARTSTDDKTIIINKTEEMDICGRGCVGLEVAILVLTGIAEKWWNNDHGVMAFFLVLLIRGLQELHAMFC